MATVTLTEEQHGQLVSDIETAKEALENAETVLANRTVDIDELLQDLQGAIIPMDRTRAYLEDF